MQKLYKHINIKDKIIGSVHCFKIKSRETKATLYRHCFNILWLPESVIKSENPQL